MNTINNVIPFLFRYIVSICVDLTLFGVATVFRILASQNLQSLLSQVILIWAALREKVPKFLSRCHTKRRTGAQGRARPSFGMTPTFYASTRDTN